MVAPRCPTCKHLWARPPAPVCPKCKVDMGWDWVELPLTGTILQYTYQVYPLWDPHEGERWSNPHPPAIILLDNGIYFRHLLEETDTKKLKEGRSPPTAGGPYWNSSRMSSRRRSGSDSP